MTGLSAAGAAGHIQPQTEGQVPALLPLVVIQPETAAFDSRRSQKNKVWEPSSTNHKVSGRQVGFMGVRKVHFIARDPAHMQKWPVSRAASALLKGYTCPLCVKSAATMVSEQLWIGCRAKVPWAAITGPSLPQLQDGQRWLPRRQKARSRCRASPVPPDHHRSRQIQSSRWKLSSALKSCEGH